MLKSHIPNYKLISSRFLLFLSAFLLIFPHPVLARKISSNCAQDNLETLTNNLLRDLPSYANRVNQRGRRLRRKVDFYSYVVTAGRPEFTPLPLKLELSEANKNQNFEANIRQVFFTTLSRQYKRPKTIEVQEFHWLLLTKSENGWWMVMMFTQSRGERSSTVPTPPRDSSYGDIGQGVNLWLRDCRAMKQ
ncbi:hypothetical protein [Calothrix sp. 336/3]|uniref:hypothetical protein n=1 Tax=Calothrix sp. 336/3 TaxID=1337936 RepID=UPI00069AB03B|nr:hypothetical protein [Calothrix sp. 336/3]